MTKAKGKKGTGTEQQPLMLVRFTFKTTDEGVGKLNALAKAEGRKPSSMCRVLIDRAHDELQRRRGAGGD